MSITVEKSPVLTMNSEMNEALEVVIQQLNKQSEHVKSVTVLPNFSVDKEAALLNNLPVVVQGLVVQLSKEYKLSPEDAVWFHPDVARGRSVFKLNAPVAKSVLQSLTLDNGNNSVGTYQVSSADEFGCEQVENHLIVNTSAKELLTDKYREWLETGVTAGELDTQWKRMKFDNSYSIVKKSEALRAAMAQKVSKTATPVYSDMTHSVLSDIQSVYIANAAVRTAEKILVKSSALGGYRMYKTGKTDRKFFLSNLGASPTFYAWSDLSTQNCQRIVNTCSWNGKLAWNAQVMQPPAVKNIKAMEEELAILLTDTFKMRHCSFSASDDISDHLAPEDVLRLTPTTEQSPNAPKFIAAPLSMRHPVMQKLMANIENVQETFNDFQLFNPKYVSNGRLNIPRGVYKHIL
jgi:hypothetical protein